MLEVRDKLLDGFHYLCLSEVLFCKQSFQFLEENVHLRHRSAGGFLHHTQCHETVHIDALPGDIELLVGLPSTSSG